MTRRPATHLPTSCPLCSCQIVCLQLKQSQKDVAELLRSGKQEYARIRVEGVIREKLLMQVGRLKRRR